MKIAVFDFDGTLYPFDTLPFLCKQLKSNSRFTYYRVMTTLVLLYVIYKLKIISGEIIKERALFTFMKSFRGFNEEEINDFFRNAYQLMKKDLNPEVVKEAETLKASGYILVVVSGACKPLVNFLGEDLGFDLVIGTEFSLNEGILKAEEDITYISGENKAAALLKILPSEEINFQESFAFADSYSDISILEMVGNPVAVNPERELYKLAVEKNWRVMGKPK
ncbi:HAD family hydrolase [Candidatus Contubernalis alkaliaceticus]|uniref:HAD family hydrolase n=1 Tax=Candidatus Contubernalis alkaliaceticus TaxID=338645 RepID=UPI001F4C521E|nr:HAD-IB family hydrolase [Candidatus Contubernalis alkalaceticus]UNC93287.1 HAD-IB family hydrolase [Candidatus Contubernalis alkalaceticus]